MGKLGTQEMQEMQLDSHLDWGLDCWGWVLEKGSRRELGLDLHSAKTSIGILGELGL